MAITVECPSCASTFPVDPNKIPEGGVKARCSSCAHVFHVDKPSDEPAAAPEPEETFAAEPEPEPEPAPEPEISAGAEEAFSEPEAPAEPAGPTLGGGMAVEEEAADEGEEEPAADDWVFETDEDVDPDSLDIEPVETEEAAAAGAADESFFDSEPEGFETSEAGADLAVEEPDAAEEPEPEPVEEEAVGPVVEPDEEEEADPASGEAPDTLKPSEPVQGFTFGKRDPEDKAKRLARVLVSDMIMYNPERHERALENDTLKEDFEEEIEKSWKEYVEQVGEEMAESTDFWREALNDVLAKGEEIF